MGDISMDEVTDWKTGVQVVTGIATLLGPVGWIGAGLLQLGIGLFMDSKSERIAKQKSKLRGALGDAMEPVIDKISEQALAILNEKILHNGIDGLLDSLNTRDNLIMDLSKSEIDEAGVIASKLKAINSTLWQEACRYLHLPQLRIYDIARIPEKLHVYGNADLSGRDIEKMERLLATKIVYQHVNAENEVVQIFWRDFGEFSVEDIHYSKDDQDEEFFAVVFDNGQIDNYSQNLDFQLFEQFNPCPVL